MGSKTGPAEKKTEAEQEAETKRTEEGSKKEAWAIERNMTTKRKMRERYEERGGRDPKKSEEGHRCNGRGRSNCHIRRTRGFSIGRVS